MDKIANHLPPMSRGKTSLTSSANAQSDEQRESKERIAKRAAFSILSCFRKSDTDDPGAYATAIARILMAYPEEVIRAVADPLTGIAGEQTFLPSIAELRASLDRRYLPIIAKQRHEEELARTRKILDGGKIEHSSPEAERVLAAAVKFHEEARQKRLSEEKREKEKWQRKFNGASDDDQKQMLHHLRLDVSPVKIGAELTKKLGHMAAGSDARDAKMF